MENLPIELLRYIALNLNHEDLFNLFQVNRKCSQIPGLASSVGEHFWYSNVLSLYPERITNKPVEESWCDYSYYLQYPAVAYYYVYKIANENKVQYQDAILLYPDYTWKPPRINDETLSKELNETVQRQQETQRRMRETLSDQMRTVLSDPIQKQLFIQTINTNHPGMDEEMLNSFCDNPDFNLFPEESTVPDQQIFIDNPEKIYLLTTKSYELIDLIDSNKKLLVNPQLYPDSYYLFAITSDIAIYGNLQQALEKLEPDDEIGLSLLNDAIKRLCADLIEKGECGTRSMSFIRLARHLCK